MTRRSFVIGAGMTGLAAGIASGFTVLETEAGPGGICASYRQDGYWFEIGGGHWIFGGDPVVTNMLQGASELRHYRRRSAILFLGNLPATRELANLVVPYPLQENLWAFPEHIRRAALAEMTAGTARAQSFATMRDWLIGRFGETLGSIFFEPFHERYTAGLYRDIAPDDTYKSPIDLERVKRGAAQANTDSGYNAEFVYPVMGLSAVSAWMADQCHVEYGATVSAIETTSRALVLADGRELGFEKVIATAPLDRLLEWMNLSDVIADPDPHTAVMVLNLGVTLPDTPRARAGYHWLYVPDSTSGFHRVGYYSNVDVRFLPAAAQSDPAHASLYVEKAFPARTHLANEERDRIAEAIVAELKTAGLIAEVLTAHSTWIETAYTWRRPGSTWPERAIAACRGHAVEPAGRYGRWKFQGIAASIKEGLALGSALRDRYPEGGVSSRVQTGSPNRGR